MNLRGHNPPGLDAVLDSHNPDHDYIADLERFIATRSHFKHFVPAVSGATAVDNALRIAMLAQPEKRVIVTFSGNYSGKNVLSVNASRQSIALRDADWGKFSPQYPDMIFIDPEHPSAADQLRTILDSGTVALVWFELIQNYMCRSIPPHLLAIVAEKKTQRGYLIGVDEVMTAFWRTSSSIFMHQDHIPNIDVMSMSKAMADMRVPIGGTMMTAEVYAAASQADPDHLEAIVQHYCFDCFASLLDVDGAMHDELQALMYRYVKRDIANWADEDDVGNASANLALIQAILEACGRHAHSLHQHPTHGPLGAVANRSVAGCKPTQAEITGIAFMILVAGFEDAVRSLATCLLLLGSDEKQRDALQADIDDGVLNAVDEMLRYDASPQVLPRVTTAACTISGVEIPEKTSVFVMLGSANRDDAVFTAADTVDFRRDNARANLTFGAGPHACPGRSAARLMCAGAVKHLLGKFESFDVDSARTQYAHSGNVRGIVELFVKQPLHPTN